MLRVESQATSNPPLPQAGEGQGVRVKALSAKAYARQLRKSPTVAEKVMWNLLRDRRCYGIKFKRQKPIGPYIVDFVAEEIGLIIELDGLLHEEQKDYDLMRDAWLEDQGYYVLRFSNEVVEYRENDIYREILGFLLASDFLPSPLAPLPLVVEGNNDCKQ